MRAPEQVIKRPLLTEKGTTLKETGGRPDTGKETDSESLSQQILFEVSREANKIEIRHAVEKIWKVNVLKVRTSVVRGKEKRLGRFTGRRSNWKKALVTLAPGQTIEFFEGA